MYDYEDYFDEVNKYKPYQSGAEELKDWFRFLDMVLEGYLEFKRSDSQDSLYSRGLVVTESEMEGYFRIPPNFRERDSCDPLLTVSAERAWEHIGSRTELTIRQLENNMSENEEGSEERNEMLIVNFLQNVFELNREGVFAVVLALACATDRRYERIFGYLQDDISQTTPTVGLLNALIARITPRENGAGGFEGLLDERLFSSLFVNTEESIDLKTELQLNPLIRRFLNGQSVEKMLMPKALSLYREEIEIPVFFETSRAQVENVLSDMRHSYCYIENKDVDTVLHLLYNYTVARNMPLYVLDLKHLMRLAPEDQFVCLADLSFRLHIGDGICSVRYETGDNGESDNAREMAAERWAMLERIHSIREQSCIILFGAKEEPGELITRSVPFLNVPEPDMGVRKEIWTFFLKEASEVSVTEDVVIDDLADCYDIPYGMIRNAVGHAQAAAITQGIDEISREMILESLRQLGQVDFSGLANYVRASYNWEDITMSDDQRAILKVACDRYRLRNRVGQGWSLTMKNAYGNGVSVLLYGPPGTGKTMAAQVVSSELGIPLYRVDISQIFSKYIGETEKNLSIIFDAAKGSNVLLFFDEADALFSKRTEINTSNDKFANTETAYLLQKIEEYDGMSILATNLYNNFDPAFMRRLTYAVRLDSPGAEARYLLWTTMLKDKSILDEDIPFRFLANKFELSGANIKAILFSAAYMAGAEEKYIGMSHIVRAMEYEYRKLGRFIAREAFGPYAKYLSMQGRGVDRWAY